MLYLQLVPPSGQKAINAGVRQVLHLPMIEFTCHFSVLWPPQTTFSFSYIGSRRQKSQRQMPLHSLVTLGLSKEICYSCVNNHEWKIWKHHLYLSCLRQSPCCVWPCGAPVFSLPYRSCMTALGDGHEFSSHVLFLEGYWTGLA